MQILVIGGGGREHAIAWKAAHSPQVKHVFVAPGNAGILSENSMSNVAIAADDLEGLLEFALSNSIDLTIVGPEIPLVAGVVDKFQEHNLKIFGPDRYCSQLEGSKSFTKAFLSRHNIPTARYDVFTEVGPAADYIESLGAPVVIKADGLAAGKGVVIAQTLKEALSTVHEMLSGEKFGEAGQKVVVEEFLVGEEASFICVVDGKTALPMASSQDHKARDNGDTGPNTGGMGAYSPAPVVTETIHQHIMRDIIQPTVNGMASEGHPFTGFLYAGLMIDESGSAKVIEFNTRLGDPETQPLLLRLESDLVELCYSALDGTLDQQPIEWNEQTALGVVMAAGGYPEKYKKGDAISGLDQPQTSTCKVFHAGTQSADAQTLTNGGRVLCVTALGRDVAEAAEKAYAAVNTISWDNVYYRTDIGHRAIKR